MHTKFWSENLQGKDRPKNTDGSLGYRVGGCGLDESG